MKNKLILALLLAALCSPSTTLAQFRVGPTLGFNVASLQHSREAREDIDDSFGEARRTPLLGIQIGATAEYALSDVLVLQSGLLFNGAGIKYKYDYSSFGVAIKGSLKTAVTYLDIPLTARYHLAEFDGFSLSGWGGLMLGLAVGGKYKTALDAGGIGIGDEYLNEDTSIDFGSSRSDDMKGIDFRLALGAVVESDEYPVQVKLALQQGLVNLIPDPESGYSLRNFLFSVSASYFFALDID